MRLNSNTTEPGKQARLKLDDNDTDVERVDDDTERGDFVRMGMDVEVKVINEEERTFEVIASTEVMDSHGDIVRQHWDLTRYELNPVILWAHNLFGVSRWAYEGSVDPEDLMPIGKAIKVEVKSKKLHATIQLVKGTAEEEPLVDKLWRRITQRVLRAVSVGFRAGSITAVKDKAGNTKFYEVGSEEFPNELHEISVVPMGSNPQAVAKSIERSREHLSRIVAARNAAVTGDTETTMAMTPEEKAAYDKALSDNATLNARVTQLETRATTAETSHAEGSKRVAELEAELNAEKALSAQHETAAKAAAERATAADARVTKSELDAREGKKFAKAQREVWEVLASAKGLEFALEKLDATADIPLATEVKVDGDPLTSATQPTPAPSDKPVVKDDLLDIARKAAAAA